MRRLTEEKALVKKIASGDSADFLKKFGVAIDIQSNIVQFSVRQAPKIDCYGNPQKYEEVKTVFLIFCLQFF